MPNKQAKIGDKYGRLTITRIVGIGKYSSKIVETICECGRVKNVFFKDISIGRSRSCGCLRLEGNHKIHGRYGTRGYFCWRNMLSRCYSKNHHSYKNYGGRGIYVCKRWKDSIDSFLEDMGEPPPNTTLERVDNSGPYSKENCAWAEIAVQANNRRNNRRITYRGKTMTLAQWSRKLGIDYDRLRGRFNLGWGPHKAFTTK